MNKKECLEELEKRGLPLTSKESMSRLRETLIQNFSSQAAPQVEVTIPTHVEAAPQVEVTIPTTADASEQLDVTLDLTTDEDVWCICGKPDDGRRYVQCSQKETCIGVKDGWFHPACLAAKGWSQPSSFRNRWMCSECNSVMAQH